MSVSIYPYLQTTGFKRELRLFHAVNTCKYDFYDFRFHTNLLKHNGNWAHSLAMERPKKVKSSKKFSIS
jgi:hypothetical protein